MKSENDPKILGAELECPACKKIEKAAGSVPVGRVIEKLDTLLSKNDLSGAERLLEYWMTEAQGLDDARGELSLVNEMLGLSRRLGNKEKGTAAISRALSLLAETEMDGTVSGATILLNAATTRKAFGAPEEAVALYEKTAAIYLAQGLDEKDSRYAAFYNNYATTLVDLARFDEAQALYEKALTLTSEIGALLDHAVTLVNLAHMHEAREGIESEKIAACLSRAETVLLEEVTERTPYYAFVAEKCAPSFDYFGHFFTANTLRDRSREIYARS